MVGAGSGWNWNRKVTGVLFYCAVLTSVTFNMCHYRSIEVLYRWSLQCFINQGHSPSIPSLPTCSQLIKQQAAQIMFPCRLSN